MSTTADPGVGGSDAPHPSGDDRYAIYTVAPRGLGRERRRLCETSREGIGLAIETMLAEDEIPRGWRVGVFDRERRAWLIDPWL